MKSWKICNSLFLATSLTLTGCGGGDSDDTPEITALSVVNPIPDQTATVGSLFDFELPTDICVAPEGQAIKLQVTQATLVAGLSIRNSDSVYGWPDVPGEASITITCSTETESATDQFTITVADRQANPVVTVDAPKSVKEGSTITLKAIAEDQNVSGSIVSYAWEQTSGIDVTLTGADSAEATFTAPESTAQSTLTFSVTVTDNDGETDTETVDIDLISAFSPDIAISFPLALGVYNEDKIDIFGSVKAASGSTLDSVTVFVDGVEHDGSPTNNTWRVKDVTVAENSVIKVIAKSTDGLINYEEITLAKTLFKTTIDNNISDIAVNDSTGDVYIFSEGNSIKFTQFNLNLLNNKEINFTRPSDFAHLGKAPTSIALDTSSNDLLVSYQQGISKIDLATFKETELSNENLGSGTAPISIFDLFFDTTNDTLYALDITNASISSVNLTSGNREKIHTTLNQPTSLAVNSSGHIYYTRGLNSLDNYDIHLYNGTSSEILNTESKGAAISDLALNEAGNELFYVDGNGDLMMLDISDLSPETPEVLVTGLFNVETINTVTTPLIGLHYHTERNVLIAAGRDADGTNKLVVIDPISGDYAKVATGDSE